MPKLDSSIRKYEGKQYWLAIQVSQTLGDLVTMACLYGVNEQKEIIQVSNWIMDLVAKAYPCTPQGQAKKNKNKSLQDSSIREYKGKQNWLALQVSQTISNLLMKTHSDGDRQREIIESTNWILDLVAEAFPCTPQKQRAKNESRNQ